MTGTTVPDPQLPDSKLASARRMRMIVMLIYYVAVCAGVIWLWSGHVRVMRWADVAALCVALICVLAAGRLLYESFNPRLLGDRLQVEGDSTPHEAAKARLSALFIFLLGLVLVLPNVAVGLGWPPAVVYGVIVVFVVARTVQALRNLRSADEYLRRRMAEAALWTLLLTTTGLLLYGGAERLGLVKVATSWDVLVVVMGLAIVTPSFLVTKPKPAA
jgi:hypothetical protein